MLPHKEICAVSGKEIVQINGYESAWGYAQTVRVGPFIFISGSVSADAQGRPTAAGDMAAQVANAYAVVAASLAAFGAGMSHIVQERLVTTDLPRFVAEGTPVRKSAYAGHSLPASSAWTEVVRLAQAEFLFEVEATAYLPVAP